MHNEYKKVLLQVIEEYSKKGPGFFQSGSILNETATRLGFNNNLEKEQALLTVWDDLFRIGYLGWGHNINNASPPFIHLNDIGRKALSTFSRDPSNPDGYMDSIKTSVTLNPVAESYIEEAIMAFNSNCYKSAAVMIGGSVESIILELRDSISQRIIVSGGAVPNRLSDWRIKTVLDKIKELLDARQNDIPRELSDNYNAYWNAFTHMIRTIRNDAGHPISIKPVTEETVHGSLLLFPEITKLASKLKEWIDNNY